MSMLEQLGVQTCGIHETLTPFEKWQGSSVQSWTIEMRLLTMGDLVEVARLTGNVSALELSYLTKVHLLSKCVTMINGKEIVTSEELEEYNKEHNLAGNNAISLFDYKILFVKKLSEAVVTRLAFMYDEMVNRYIASLLGTSVIPPELDATKFDASSNNDDEQVSDDSDSSSTTP